MLDTIENKVSQSAVPMYYTHYDLYEKPTYLYRRYISMYLNFYFVLSWSTISTYSVLFMIYVDISVVDL